VRGVENIGSGRNIKITGGIGTPKPDKGERVKAARGSRTRQMKVKKQGSADKSCRGLKGGSVGVNGPCP